MPSDKKQTNPKDAVGIAKVPRSTLSARVMAEAGLAMLEGALKYGRHNYRVAGVRASVYYDAVDRHMSAWWEGQDTDPESGLSHVTKAIAGLMVLRDSMLQGNWVDDRPPKTSDVNWVADLNDKAKKLLEKYPNPVAAHTELDDSLRREKERDREMAAHPGEQMTRFKVGDKVRSKANISWCGPMVIKEFYHDGGFVLSSDSLSSHDWAHCQHPALGLGSFQLSDLELA